MDFPVNAGGVHDQIPRPSTPEMFNVCECRQARVPFFHLFVCSCVCACVCECRVSYLRPAGSLASRKVVLWWMKCVYSEMRVYLLLAFQSTATV